MYELDFTVFPQNAGLTICPLLIARIVNAVRAGVPACARATYADVIQVKASQVPFFKCQSS